MMKITILLINIFFLIPFASIHSQIYSKIVFSEVMFNPAENNGEFIEIYNSSSTESFNLDGYKIKYATSSAESISTIDHNYEIKPNSFAVILESDYDFDSGIITTNLPEGTLQLILKDDAFGSSGMANTSDKTITLINNYDQPVAVYTYTADNAEGISDEKLILDRNDTSENWGNAIRQSGTPGHINSISPKLYDVAINEFFTNKEYCVFGENETFFVKIKNEGAIQIDSFCMVINQHSSSDSHEEIYNRTYYNLLPADSLLAAIECTTHLPGKNKFAASLNYTQDEYILNNSLTFEIPCVVINELPGDLVINEIQYAPPDNEPEWIEVFNKSEKEINLSGYTLADRTSEAIVITESLQLAPEKFLIISKDSSITNKFVIESRLVVASFPALNNSDDKIFLSDSLGRVIDSVEYFSAWGGGNGTSLERIDPSGDSNDSGNWKSNRNEFGATPGNINSVTQKNKDISLIDFNTYPEFPCISDAVRLSVTTKNIGKLESEFMIELYNTNSAGDNKTLVETGVLANLSPGDSVEYTFNHIIGNLTNENYFIIKAQCGGDQDTANNIMFTAIVPGYPPGSIAINEIMFDPMDEEPEWIELYNNSQYQINISNWTISDVLTTPSTNIITEEDLYIEPQSYLLIVRDSSVLNYHREIPGETIVLDFANLNNDEDGVVLKDFRGLVIDSTKYYESWNIGNGFSIERKELSESSTSPSNWNPSIDHEKSTPCRINSVTEKDYDLSVKSISTIPRFPVIGDDVYVNVVLKNYGLNEANELVVRVYYSIDDTELLLSENNVMHLSPAETMVIKPADQIIINEAILLRVEIEFAPDWDTYNNFAAISVIPGYNNAALLINEILYDPPGEMAECFELFNNSNETINLKNWSVSDILSTPTKNVITFDDCFVEPGEFIVITSDPDDMGTDEETNIFEVDFGSLSNTKDGLILYDFRNAVIDSVMYENSWGGGNGKSLERLSPSEPAQSKTNWATSLSESGNSIGRENVCSGIEQAEFMNVILNEIMFDPADDNSEYIEIYNMGNEQVEIGGWRICDGSNNEFELSRQSKLLMPGNYFVVAADSSIFECYNFPNDCESVCVVDKTNLGLSNDGEKLYLKDLWSNIVDSMSYNCDWHNRNFLTTKNKSLEKINQSIISNDASNWSTSVNENGGTPGYENSIHIQSAIVESNLEINPNPFSPDNDGFEDFTMINYSLSQNIAQLRLKIFDSKGRLVRELLNNMPSGSSGAIIFDGLDNNGHPLKIGIYIVFMEALNSTSGVVEVLKGVVVIARKI